MHIIEDKNECSQSQGHEHKDMNMNKLTENQIHF